MQVFECYGCGYQDDVDNHKYRLRDKVSHRQSAIKALKKIVRIYDLSIEQLDNGRIFGEAGNPTYHTKINSNVLRDQLKYLFGFQKYWFEQMEAVQHMIQNIPDENCDFVNLPQGHLVSMTCGHRGMPNRLQEKRVSRLLRKSGFIPMLELSPTTGSKISVPSKGTNEHHNLSTIANIVKDDKANEDEIKM